jgi:hypothetical protein
MRSDQPREAASVSANDTRTVTALPFRAPNGRKADTAMTTRLFFSDHFGVDPRVLEDYGAFNISLESDMPLFIDPLLLFHSDKSEYQDLHQQIIRYVLFLRDQAALPLDEADLRTWFCFREVKQNWLGFTYMGNSGSGLGRTFASALGKSLKGALRTFGQETVSHGSHLEKLTLIRGRVGRDNISDLTTNLIKDYLLEFTQAFAREHLRPEQRETFAVTRARFNYDTKVWETRRYELPILDHDYVLLTPADILTRDDTWINYGDMVSRFYHMPQAIPDDQLRAQVNAYLASRLNEKSTPKDHERVAQQALEAFPELLDHYIRHKEDDGDRAHSVSARKRVETRRFLEAQLRALIADLSAKSEFLNLPATSYDECLAKVLHFKHYIEDRDGYRKLNPPGAKKPSNEKDVQLFFGLLLSASPFDVNREANNGRGPVDFAVSRGRSDKTLIEVKLASNSRLKQNLEKQVGIYQLAHGAPRAVTMIVCYTGQDLARVEAVLSDLKLTGNESVVVINARNDDKPSASRA